VLLSWHVNKKELNWIEIIIIMRQQDIITQGRVILSGVTNPETAGTGFRTVKSVKDR
jgi:hypothetical protein